MSCDHIIVDLITWRDDIFVVCGGIETRWCMGTESHPAVRDLSRLENCWRIEGLEGWRTHWRTSENSDPRDPIWQGARFIMRLLLCGRHSVVRLSYPRPRDPTQRPRDVGLPGLAWRAWHGVSVACLLPVMTGSHRVCPTATLPRVSSPPSQLLRIPDAMWRSELHLKEPLPLSAVLRQASSKALWGISMHQPCYARTIASIHLTLKVVLYLSELIFYELMEWYGIVWHDISWLSMLKTTF